MERVYFLIDTTSGSAAKVAEALRRKPCVSLVDTVAGAHDMIAVLDRKTGCSAGTVSLEEIRAIDGVDYVTVCVAVRRQD